MEELTTFPVHGDLSPQAGTEPNEAEQVPGSATSGRRPIVGAMGKVIGWTDEEDDAEGVEAAGGEDQREAHGGERGD